jgi:hypothetical protein
MSHSRAFVPTNATVMFLDMSEEPNVWKTLPRWCYADIVEDDATGKMWVTWDYDDEEGGVLRLRNPVEILR